MMISVGMSSCVKTLICHFFPDAIKTVTFKLWMVSFAHLYKFSDCDHISGSKQHYKKEEKKRDKTQC